jgi:hypothetical protein
MQLDTKITVAQMLSLHRKWLQTADHEDTQLTTFAEFIEDDRVYLSRDGAVMLYWKSMWLGIEPDGYTHS